MAKYKITENNIVNYDKRAYLRFQFDDKLMLFDLKSKIVRFTNHEELKNCIERPIKSAKVVIKYKDSKEKSKNTELEALIKESNFGSKFKEYREKVMKLDRVELATIIGTSEGNIRLWEEGFHLPSLFFAYKLLIQFELNILDLLDKEEWT